MIRKHSLLPALACLVLSTAARAENPEEEAWFSGGADAVKVCAKCLDDYLIVPNYRSDCGSSRGLTAAQWRQKLALEYTWRHDGKTEKRALLPDEDDVRAADALPSLDPGDYGWLHSVEIVRISGPNDMMVKGLWLDEPTDAAKELKKYAARIAARFQQAEKDVRSDHAARITALEKESKDLTAWRNAAQKATGRVNRDPHDPSLARINAIAAEIRKIRLDETADLKELGANREELLKLAKQRVQPAIQDSSKAAMEAAEVREKFLRDLKEPIRLVGFSTDGLRIGDRFSGPHKDGLQVAVAWRDKDGRRVLATAKLLQKPIDKAEWRAFLARRNVTPRSFAVQMAVAKQGKSGAAMTAAMRKAMGQWIRTDEPQPTEK